MPTKGLEAEKVYWDEFKGREPFMQVGTSLVRGENGLVFTGEDYDSEDNRQYAAIVHFDPQTFFDGISRLGQDGAIFINARKPHPEASGMSLKLEPGKERVHVFVYAENSGGGMGFRMIVPRETFHEEEARAAVIAANAQISPDQFRALQDSLGQEVEMQYGYHKIYADEEPSTHDTAIERFILRDVNFVRDPRTNQTYLAFLRTDYATNYPYWSSESAFGDFTEVQINKIKQAGRELWSFDHPGERVNIKRWGSDIIGDIKDHSESMSALAINK